MALHPLQLIALQEFNALREEILGYKIVIRIKLISPNNFLWNINILIFERVCKVEITLESKGSLVPLCGKNGD